MNVGKGVLWLWGPVVLYIGFIFWFSSSPRPIPAIEIFPWVDKPYHALEYIPLGSLLTRALRRSLKPTAAARGSGTTAFWPAAGWQVKTLGLIGALVVGTADEFYQRFIPLKHSSPWDVVWDGIGASVGQAFYWFKWCRSV